MIVLAEGFLVLLTFRDVPDRPPENEMSLLVLIGENGDFQIAYRTPLRIGTDVQDQYFLFIREFLSHPHSYFTIIRVNVF